MFVASNNGRIEYEYLRGRKGEVRLSWDSLYSLGSDLANYKEVSQVRYKLVFSNNSEAIMDSVCGIKAMSSAFTVYEDIDGDNEYVIALPRGQEIQFNVIAVVENQ